MIYEGLEYTSNGDGTCYISGYEGDHDALNIPTSSPKGDIVIGIGEDAFSSNPYIEQVFIPDTITSIGPNAFNNSINITSIVIGNNVTEIGDYAFFNCNILESIVIPNKVTSIGT